MEGFGMTSQEAAATRVPVIASQLVPFVTEYLLGDNSQKLKMDGSETQIFHGEGALVVPPDDVSGFVEAMQWLLAHEDERRRMGERAYSITIPYFTWANVVQRFLSESCISVDEGGGM
jgi:glycosyltransferase involved in cell wall biosynthesis